MEREAPTASTTTGSGSNAWRIFINLPQGQIEDWVRDLACKLIFDHKLPEEEGLGAIGDISQAMATVGTDDDIDSNVNPYGEEGGGSGGHRGAGAATGLSNGPVSGLCPN